MLLVGICAEMDDTSFEFVQPCSAAGPHCGVLSASGDAPVRETIVHIWGHVLVFSRIPSSWPLFDVLVSPL